MTSVMAEGMRIGHWENFADRAKLEYLEKILFQCEFVHDKSDTECRESTWASVLRG